MRWVLWLAVVLVAVVGVVSASAKPPSPICDGTWQIVPSPQEFFSQSLNAVDARSEKDVWAVGGGLIPGQPGTAALIEHWDGKDWTIVPAPQQAGFAGVAAISAADAWAVGSDNSQPVVARWNGRSWNLVPSASVSGPVSGLLDVSAVSRSSVWAVGGDGNAELIEQWDGKTWAKFPSLGQVALSAVAAINSNDVWAVSTSDGPNQALIEHWNGVEWLVVPAPADPFGFSSGVEEVSATGSDDVWAVGHIQRSESFVDTAGLILHWDGSVWASTLLIESGRPVFLHDVAAAAPDDVWVVGTLAEVGTGPAETYTAHWDGQNWTRIPSPNPHTGAFADANGLSGVTSVSDSVWAVTGGFLQVQGQGGSPSVIMRLCGSLATT